MRADCDDDKRIIITGSSVGDCRARACCRGRGASRRASEVCDVLCEYSCVRIVVPWVADRLLGAYPVRASAQSAHGRIAQGAASGAARELAEAQRSGAFLGRPDGVRGNPAWPVS